MKNQVCTLLCACLISLPGTSRLLAHTAAPALPVSAHAARPQTLVDVNISLPYQGVDNYWDITFTDNATNASYSFSTGDNTFATGVLGAIPEGVYTVTFTQQYGHHNHFEFYVGCDQTRIRSGTSETLYNRTISSDCSIVIIDQADTI